jgi:hypothetical protein
VIPICSQNDADINTAAPCPGQLIGDQIVGEI